MIRIIRVLKILQMAAHASRLGQVVVVVDMAIHAGPGRHGVHASERKSCRRVIELGVEPVVGRMAGLAGGGEFAGCVVGIPGAGVILLMATEARRRHRSEITERAVLVAVVAGGGRVRTRERESVHVLIDLLYRNLPAANRVAGLAVLTHLVLVDVGMAVGALVADVGEHHLGVAGGTGHALMHTAQRIARPIVIKFRHRTNRLPAVDRVAVLAGDIQVAVRAMRALGALCNLRRTAS